LRLAEATGTAALVAAIVAAAAAAGEEAAPLLGKVLDPLPLVLLLERSVDCFIAPGTEEGVGAEGGGGRGRGGVGILLGEVVGTGGFDLVDEDEPTVNQQ
jgi:hypothetical protein